MSSYMTSFAPKYDDTYARLKDETYARLRCACRHISVQKRHIWRYVRLAQVYASSHFGAKTAYMTTCTQGSGVTCRVISVQKRHNNDDDTYARLRCYMSSYFSAKTSYMTTSTQGSGVRVVIIIWHVCTEIWRHVTPEPCFTEIWRHGHLSLFAFLRRNMTTRNTWRLCEHVIIYDVCAPKHDETYTSALRTFRHWALRTCRHMSVQTRHQTSSTRMAEPCRLSAPSGP